MTTVLLAGLGAVGSRAARQLADTAGVELLVTDRSARRADALAEVLGGRVRAVELDPTGALPEGADVVAAALPGAVAARWGAHVVQHGLPYVSSADDEIDAIRALDGAARQYGVAVLAGCGLAPGLADVLAKHAAASFDEVDEVHVARAGTAGPASRAARRAGGKRGVREWHDDGWRVVRSVGPELVCFPDPVGARECVPTGTGIELLVGAFGGLRRATVRQPLPESRWSLPGTHDDPWGAARVEVWGRRAGRHEPVVYGVVEHTAVAAGTVLAVAAAGLGGALRVMTPQPGVAGLAEVVDAPAFLAELAHRGVKAAVFEGIAAG